jgi:adenylate kinase
VIIIIGIAGAGKSTQGHILAKRLNCTWLSVGQMLRDHVDEALKEKMLKGEMVSDQKMLGLLGEELKKLGADKNEVILDGAPRTLYQAQWLAKKIKAGEIKMTAVIHIKASKETVKKRLLGRGRPDDNEEAINQRFMEFGKSILPIINYFESQGFKIYHVDGEGPVEADAKAIEQTLGF